MDIEVSIILPCYNVESHLKKSIESIYKQTFNNFEAIFVNDGSIDDTLKVFNEIEPDCRFKMFTKKNGGSGSARNYGLDYAKGKYIYFMDPDDVIEPNLIEENVKNMELYNSDLNIFGYRSVDFFSGKTKIHVPTEGELMVGKEVIRKKIAEDNNNINFGSVWGKFYRHEFLINNNLRFTDLRVGQDVEFNWQVFDFAENVTIISEVFYNYFTNRPGSTRTEYNSHQFKSEKIILKTMKAKAKKWRMESEFKSRIDNYKIYATSGELLNLVKGEKKFDKLLIDSLYLEVKSMKFKRAKSMVYKIRLVIIKYPMLARLAKYFIT